MTVNEIYKKYINPANPREGFNKWIKIEKVEYFKEYGEPLGKEVEEKTRFAGWMNKKYNPKNVGATTLDEAKTAFDTISDKINGHTETRNELTTPVKTVVAEPNVPFMQRKIIGDIPVSSGLWAIAGILTLSTIWLVVKHNLKNK